MEVENDAKMNNNQFSHPIILLWSPSPHKFSLLSRSIIRSQNSVTYQIYVSKIYQVGQFNQYLFLKSGSSNYNQDHNW